MKNKVKLIYYWPAKHIAWNVRKVL